MQGCVRMPLNSLPGRNRQLKPIVFSAGHGVDFNAERFVVNGRTRRYPVKIHLERGKCSGHAQCYVVDADFFPIDDEGYSILAERTVEAGDEEVARRGVSACPENALVIDENG